MRCTANRKSICGRTNRLRRIKRRGTIVMLAAIFMTALVGMLALAIDTGMMTQSRTELQQVVDAAALAGAAELASGSHNEAEIARQFANMNRRQGDQLRNEQIKVEIGVWDRSSHTFVPNVEPADAVRVFTRLNDRPVFFAAAMGSKNFSSEAAAIATFQPRDIMLVLDYSGSMASENKIGNLKSAVALFCNLVETSSRGSDRVGFVKYSTTASLEEGLTFKVNDVSTEAQLGAANGFTDIGDAMNLAREELQNNGRPRAKKLMLLLTDGLANRPPHKDPVQYVNEEAGAAAQNGYPIVSVSFGSDADQSLMAHAAQVTRGVHFHVDGSLAQQAADLKEVFRKVALNRNLQLVD